MAFTINATINGVQIPVEVSEEELERVGREAMASADLFTDILNKEYSDGYRQGYDEGEVFGKSQSGASEETLKAEYQRGYADGTGYGLADGAISQRKWIIDKIACDIAEDKYGCWDDICRNNEDAYADFVDTFALDNDEELFADAIVNGSLKRAIEEWLEEHKSKAKYYEFEVELKRIIVQTATVTISVKAESEEEANDYLDMDADVDDIADYIGEYDWETTDDGETTIEDFYLEETYDNEDDAENLING